MIDALSNMETLGEYTPVPPAERPFEFMLNALRLTEGFSNRLFTECTGLDSLLIEPQIRRARREGLLYDDTEIIQPTARGMNFYNELCARFIP